MIKRHEGTIHAISAHPHGFEAINVGTSDFAFLFYLDEILAFLQGEFAFLLLGGVAAGLAG